MFKIISFFIFFISSIILADKLTQDTYRNSKENQRKREQAYLAIKKQVNENVALINERLKKIQDVLNFELKQEKPKITTKCIPLLLVNSKNEETTVYDEQAALELEKERLEQIEFQARVKLANFNSVFPSKPSDIGSPELKAKSLEASMDFPPTPEKFSYKKFCHEFLNKKESKDQPLQTQPR